MQDVNFIETIAVRADARARARTSTRILLACTLVLALAAILSRYHFIENRPLAGRMDGQEPEAHIIITEMAFDQVPWRTHHFLPLFTLGPRSDKFIDQHPGAASADAQGNYFYTSTPPLTFVLPYLAAKLTAGAPTLHALRWYNVSLGIVASVCLALLVYLCLARKHEPGRTSVALACTAAVIYLAAPESLKSHSIDIWAQQFTAVLLPVQIIALLFYPVAWLLFLLAFIGCLADWTPYVANVTMIGLALVSAWKTHDGKSLRAALAIAAGCLCGGLAMIAWFNQVMGVSTYFHDLAVRSEARSIGGIRAFYYFLPRYLESFGIFAVIGLAALAWRIRTRQAPAFRAGPEDRPRVLPKLLAQVDPLLMALVIMGAALLENPLMKDHALLYSYDRLKGVQFLALIVAWCVSRSSRASVFAYWSSAGAAIISMAVFVFSYDTPWGWNAVAHSQQERLGAIIARTAAPDAPVFFNGEVRGSEIYYAGRNIFEHVDKVAAEHGMDTASFVREWCTQHGFSQGTVYELSGDYPWPRSQDLPRSVTVTQVFGDARPALSNTVVLDERPGDYHPMQSSERFGHLPDRFWR